MKITFFNNKSNHNVVNKSLEKIKTLDFKFKNESNILKPILLLKNYDGGNYCFIEELKRYYFIDTIDILNNNLVSVSCSIDVLMSYRDFINNTEFYSDDGTLTVESSQLDFNEVYSIDRFIMLIGG